MVEIELGNYMRLKYISWIPALIVMCLIFSFSAKTAVESDGNSLQIANVFVNLYENMNGGDIGESEKAAILLQVNHVVRKMAHGIEYVVLSLCISFHLWVCDRKRNNLLFLSVLVSGIYAATDEFHQVFVAGRCGRITDVLIDTTGAIIGAAFFLLVIKLFRGRQIK